MLGNIKIVTEEYSKRWHQIATAMAEGTTSDHVEMYRQTKEAQIIGVRRMWHCVHEQNFLEMQRVVDELKSKDLLHDADLSGLTFKGLNLAKANLSGSKLYLANLANCNLQSANLDRIVVGYGSFFDADMENCKMRNADLRLAHLGKANLRNANLENTDFSGALMHATNLSGANLKNADLAYIESQTTIRFDFETTLPNGKKWTSSTKMSSFTKYKY